MTTRTGCDNYMHRSLNGLDTSFHTIHNPTLRKTISTKNSIGKYFKRELTAH